MDLLHQSTPVQGANSLLSNLPSSTLTSSSSAGHGRSVLATPSPNHAGIVISKIEDIFEAMADCILGEKEELTIQLKSRSGRGAKVGDQSDREHENGTAAKTSSRKKQSRNQFRTITFPSKSPQEAWKFTALLRILELSHEALVSGVVTTKRDIYYRDPELFLRQAVVDKYVDDIAFTLGIERDALNIVAAAKGLIAGALKATRQDETVFDYSTEPDGFLTPNVKGLTDLSLTTGVRWVLVIEKEATFRTLATSFYWRDSLAGKGVILTAKGYPDIQTRHFLNVLSTHFPHIPIFALVDFDPDGLGIASTYKHGSINLAHEVNLAVPCIQWLGVRGQDFLYLNKEKDAQGMLKLTARDRRIAMRMLAKEDVFGERGMEQEWRREIQTMLMLNMKAEIQILGNVEALANWLDEKLINVIGDT